MINNIIIIVLFLLISVNFFKDNINLIYFIPICGLLLIYINTSVHEHFLCKLENSVTNIFETNQFLGNLKNKIQDNYLKYKPDVIFNKFRDDTRNNLLKINKSAEKIILKI
jgi:hypothetical protein